MIQPLDLPQSPRDAVYRAMEAIVRKNSTIGRIIKPSSFRTWSGKPDDAKEFTYAIAPAMRWTPMNGPEEFKTPDSMAGPLYINCEILLPGNNVSDLANFWWSLVKAFYPTQSPPAPNPVPIALQLAGARSGLVKFSQPAFDPSPDGVWLAGQGQISIDIQLNLDS